MRTRAIAVGWSAGDIVVIDNDLGRPATAAADRDGFERVITEVGAGRVGIVLGFDASRLARDHCDWRRMLEVCARTDTLIGNEDTLYHPQELQS